MTNIRSRSSLIFSKHGCGTIWTARPFSNIYHGRASSLLKTGGGFENVFSHVNDDATKWSLDVNDHAIWTSLCTLMMQSEIVHSWWRNLNPSDDAIKFKLCVDDRISTCTCIIINLQLELTASSTYRLPCCDGGMSYSSRSLAVKLTEHCLA